MGIPFTLNSVFLFTFNSALLLTITYVFLFTIGCVFQFTLSTTPRLSFTNLDYSRVEVAAAARRGG